MPSPFSHLQESLSASRIGTLLRCPLRYRFQYVEKLPWEKLPGAMLLGSAVDATTKEAVVLLKQGWRKSPNLELDEVFDQYWRIETESPRAPIAWGKRHDQESMRDLGRSLMHALGPVLFTEDRLERIVDRDAAFVVPLLDDKGVPLLDCPLCGLFDFVEEIDGKRVPLELKTSATRTAHCSEALSRDPQALIYGLASQTLQRDGEARVRYVSAIKLKSPEVIETDHVVDASQLDWARKLIVGAKNAIDAGNFYPAPSVMNCGGCPFAEACAKSDGCARVKSKRIFSAA